MQLRATRSEGGVMAPMAGMVFVTSGYGSFTQTPGNLLVALKPGRPAAR
jgi:hypothetical protein